MGLLDVTKTVLARATGLWTRLATPLAAVASAIVLGSCSGPQSALSPKGHGAKVIAGLWWLIFWIATAVFIIVVGFLAVAVVRGRRIHDQRVDKREVRWGDGFIVVSGVVLPAIILTMVFVVSLADLRSTSGAAARPTIEIVGHDWWWEARYSNGAVTANEIHIPAGQEVRLRLMTADVIHSFWVPQLQAKTDEITGRVNSMLLEADRPGRYRGQCAEFCGLQHANMGLYVIAQPPSAFRSWLSREARPAARPAGRARAGQKVFLTNTCAGCHAIAGTPARARVGPDLTHVAARRTLLAATIPNTRANLAKLITAPQSIKPGIVMPPTELAPSQLKALVDYLDQLK